MTHPLDIVIDECHPRTRVRPDIGVLTLWVGQACAAPSLSALEEVVERAAGWMANLDVSDPAEAMRDEYDQAVLKHPGMTLDQDTPTDAQRAAALVEELGEVARALTYDQDHAGDISTELTQLAALAAAWATKFAEARG